MNKMTKNTKDKSGRRRFLRLAVLGIGATIVGGSAVYLYDTGSSAGTDAGEDSAYVRRETKPTLSPALFVGKIQAAYEVAHDTPELLDHLYCYCECDKHAGHKSLLSCYTDNHAANCTVCVNEALDAAKMMKDGYEMTNIRRQIDRKYSRS